MFDIKNVHTAVNADNCELYNFGYFANDIASLKQTVKNKKSSLRTIYAVLTAVLDEKYERRFSCPYGNFSLFYPTDTSENRMRY